MTHPDRRRAGRAIRKARRQLREYNARVQSIVDAWAAFAAGLASAIEAFTPTLADAARSIGAFDVAWRETSPRTLAGVATHTDPERTTQQ